MPTTITPQIALLGFAAAVLTVAAPLPVSAQMAACNWYADTALSQQQRNEQGRCGFTGAGWNLDRPAHIAWCATQTPDRWQAEARKREQMLSECKK